MGEILNEGQVPVKSTTVSTGRLYTMRKYAILVSLWRHGSRTTTELLLDMADYEISIVGEENAKLAKEYKVLRKAYHPAAHDSSFRCAGQNILDNMVARGELRRITTGNYRLPISKQEVLCNAKNTMRE